MQHHKRLKIRVKTPDYDPKTISNLWILAKTFDWVDV